MMMLQGLPAALTICNSYTDSFLVEHHVSNPAGIDAMVYLDLLPQLGLHAATNFHTSTIIL